MNFIKSDLFAVFLVVLLTIAAFFIAQSTLAAEVCYSDLPCTNPHATCVLDPYSLLGSGHCDKSDVVISDTVDAVNHT